MSFFDKPIKDEMTKFKNTNQKKLAKTIFKYQNIIENIKLQLEDEDLKYKYSIVGIRDRETSRILNGPFTDFKNKSSVVIKNKWIEILNNYLITLKEYYERKGKEIYEENKIKIKDYHKTEITCECGFKITRVNLSRHKNTHNHIKLLSHIKLLNQKKEEEEEEQAQLTPCKLEEQIC